MPATGVVIQQPKYHKPPADLMHSVTNSGSFYVPGDTVSVASGDLEFGFVRNSNNNYASLCVRSNKFDDSGVLPVNIFVGISDIYDVNTESMAKRVTAGDNWVVLDDNGGYTIGQSYYLNVMDVDTFDLYVVRGTVTYESQTGRADMAVINVSYETLTPPEDEDDNSYTPPPGGDIVT